MLISIHNAKIQGGEQKYITVFKVIECATSSLSQVFFLLPKCHCCYLWCSSRAKWKAIFLSFWEKPCQLCVCLFVRNILSNLLKFYLDDYTNFQALLTKLESEKANVQKDIEQGKRLQQDRNAPGFISQTISDLDKKWRDTNQLAQAKHSKLKVYTI